MASNFYVSTTGNDSNAGTLDSPFATLQKAHDQVQVGDTIYMRGGRYKLPKDTTTFLSKDGTADNPIRLFAYKNETPILDASDWTRAQVPYDEATRKVIVQEGDAWHIKGLEMTGGARGFFLARSVSDSRWENLNVHHNDNTGFNLSGDNSNNNLVVNSDFHHNFDPVDNGQDADGIGFIFGSGTGNVLRNSRLYNNSDDGLDLWQFKDAVTVEGNWSYGNGVDRWNFGPAFEGNGMGFKLGGGSPTVPSVSHIARNNLSWENAGRGFDNNSNAGSIQAYNNTSYMNGENGFYFTDSNHRLRNNVSVGDETIVTSDEVDDTFNSWSTDVKVEGSDFQSLDSSIAKGARPSNGALPDSPFLQLTPDSDLIDAGVDVGQPFQGASPDFGAIETQAGSPSQLQPVAKLQFNEGSGQIAKDTSLEGRNPGTLLSGSAWGTGIQNGAVQLEAEEQGVAIANSKDLNLGIHEQRTVSLWFNADQTSLGSGKQVLYEEGGNLRGLNAYLDNGKLFVGGWNRPAQESNWSGNWLSSDRLSSNQWHHVAIVLEGEDQVQDGSLTAYLDGQSLGSSQASQLWEHNGGIGVGTVNRQTRFADGRTAKKGQSLSGAIDELEIYNQALDPDEIKALSSLGLSPLTQPSEAIDSETSKAIAPDVDALQDGQAAYAAGALLTSEDLAPIQLDFKAAGEFVNVVISELPTAGIIPESFKINIGEEILTEDDLITVGSNPKTVNLLYENSAFAEISEAQPVTVQIGNDPAISKGQFDLVSL